MSSNSKSIDYRPLVPTIFNKLFDYQKQTLRLLPPPLLSKNHGITTWTLSNFFVKFVILHCFYYLFVVQLSSMSENSWHWVYYVHALVTPILFIAWFLLYRDLPQRSKCVSVPEFQRIQRGKSQSELQAIQHTPYFVCFC